MTPDYPTFSPGMERCENCEDRPSLPNYDWCIQCFGNSENFTFHPHDGTVELTMSSSNTDAFPESDTQQNFWLTALLFVGFILLVFACIVTYT